jgi:hypothetical protein
MEIKQASPGEMEAMIRLLIETGEWDSWKLNYLKENWESTISTLTAVLNNEDLGGFYVLRENGILIGVLPIVRVGKEGLFFSCLGVKTEFSVRASTIIDTNFFGVLPRGYKILMNYTRPSSTGVVPKFIRDDFGINNASEMFERSKELPSFIQDSITISPPFWYMERQVEESRGLQDFMFWKNSNIVPSEIQSFFGEQFIETFDIFDRKTIAEIYRKHGFQIDMRTARIAETILLCLCYPYGLTPSGYTNATYVIGPCSQALVDNLSSLYSGRGEKRLLVFVPSLLRNSFERFGFKAIKQLHQIFYDIKKNSEWRQEFRGKL